MRIVSSIAFPCDLRSKATKIRWPDADIYRSTPLGWQELPPLCPMDIRVAGNKITPAPGVSHSGKKVFTHPNLTKWRPPYSYVRPGK